MADYWIKAFIEIIDDPKMATMPDRLWRRSMEIFLLAGRYSKDRSGQLPDTNQLAWALRMSTDDLLTDLKQLESVGIVRKTKDGWLVVNFEKRQSAATDAERKRQQREREQRSQYYSNEDVTNQSRNVTQINRLTETETETDTDTKEAAAVYKTYSDNIGLLTGAIAEHIDADIKEYTAQLVIDAIKEATRQEKRNLAYVEGILKRWKLEGKNNNHKKNGMGGKFTNYDKPTATPEEIRKALAEGE